MTHRVESTLRFDSMSFYINIDFFNKAWYNTLVNSELKGDAFMIKALIVGVCDCGIPSKYIPLCYNDIHAMKQALISGLSANEENITVLGENKRVNKESFLFELENIKNATTASDVYTASPEPPARTPRATLPHFESHFHGVVEPLDKK